MTVGGDGMLDANGLAMRFHEYMRGRRAVESTIIHRGATDKKGGNRPTGARERFGMS